jgi:flagellar motor switch protein FliN
MTQENNVQTHDEAKKAQFAELSKENVSQSDTALNKDFGVLLDVPVTLSLEVGRTSISIKNVLQLNQGSVVELGTAPGEPLNVLVNGTLIAHAEVVVVNEKFGIRLLDVMSPSDRVQMLK